MHAAQQADAEGEDGGGRRRARDVRRDARQAEREVQANRMRKKYVRPVTPILRCCPMGRSCSLQQDRPVMPRAHAHACTAQCSSTCVPKRFDCISASVAHLHAHA